MYVGEDHIASYCSIAHSSVLGDSGAQTEEVAPRPRMVYERSSLDVNGSRKGAGTNACTRIFDNWFLNSSVGLRLVKFGDDG